ncbi:uncharacterized protein LOC129905102 [Episyrphus balteatus]|uniref:uncharacterized protein LOC129905102 n=1 Tax=Episyrphus balteatus TaxID=286459 RepID=UPI002486BB1A|nr:uncharacterized protein LOC129905102 [Episyrphus balteatus]XP_055836459.1 uncharacterized protein LOC129905102 [Episyrphus balteatus]
MGTPMHFRKRQLLEYQIQENSSQQNEPHQTQLNEPNCNYSYEPQITFEYPMSPASTRSDRSTPTKNEPYIAPSNFDSLDPSEYSTEQMQVLAKHTVALLEMENLSPKSNKDAQKLKQIGESLTALENFCQDPSTHLGGSVKKLTYEPSTLLHFAYNLKETIEEYISQEIANASPNKSSLSTLILAKLNQLRVNALLKPQQRVVEQLKYVPGYCSPEKEFEDMPVDLSGFCKSEMQVEEGPEDLSIKRNKPYYETGPVASLPVEDDDMDYDEPTLVIDESYVETQIGDDTIIQKSPEKTKSVTRHTRSGLQQIASRISGIFSFINRTQSRMEELMRQGINVVTLTSSKKSKKKSSKKSKKSTTTTSSSSSSTSSAPAIYVHPAKRVLELKQKSSKKSKKIPILPSMPAIQEESPPPAPAGRVIVYNRKPWTNGLGDEFKYNTNYPIPSPYDSGRCIIGPNGTTISNEEWLQINWDQTPPCITRRILMMLFNRECLATHSLTGRPSPAFLELNYPEKQALNPYIVKDIVDLVTSRTIATAKEVRMAITTKCADESKMRRCREAKLLKQAENLRMKPY